MGKIASVLSSKVIFTSDNPRHEDPELIISDMEEELSLTTIIKLFQLLIENKPLRLLVN